MMMTTTRMVTWRDEDDDDGVNYDDDENEHTIAYTLQQMFAACPIRPFIIYAAVMVGRCPGC